MMGVIPGELDERGVRLAGLIFTGLGLVVLAGCTFWVAAIDKGDSGSWWITLGVGTFTAALLLLLPVVFPRRNSHPWATTGFYAVVLTAAAVLIARNDAFTAFASSATRSHSASFPLGGACSR